jgi:putative ABC transport system substrate-binding protein
MRRREFIKLVGGAAAAWPFEALAQQPERARRIGVLMPFAETDAEGKLELEEFVHQLEALGSTVGQNLRIDFR